MTDESVPTQGTGPVVSVLKAPELINKAVAGIPDLATEQDALQLVFGAYAQFVVPKMDRKQAESLLGAFFNVKPAAVQAAVLKINKIVLDQSKAVAENAQSAMGIEIDPRTLDNKRRTQEEVDEQNGLNTEADHAIANVSAVIAGLGLRDLYAEELAVKNKKPRKSLAAPIVKGLVESGWLKTDRPLEMEPEKPGWETPPVFDTSDPEVKRLLAKLDGVLTLLSSNVGPTQREQVEAQLANFSVTREDLEETLYKISVLAHGQLNQSAEILARVTSDNKYLSDQIEAINFVKGVYAAVINYFFPDYSLKGTK